LLEAFHCGRAHMDIAGEYEQIGAGSGFQRLAAGEFRMKGIEVKIGCNL
jgi:hypothetical protein